MCGRSLRRDTIHQVSGAEVLQGKPERNTRELETIRGIGNLNYSHLSRVLDYATGCGVEAIQNPQETPIKTPKSSIKTHTHTRWLAGLDWLEWLGYTN